MIISWFFFFGELEFYYCLNETLLLFLITCISKLLRPFDIKKEYIISTYWILELVVRTNQPLLSSLVMRAVITVLQ